LRREDLWSLRHSLNAAKLDNPELHDEIILSYKDKVLELSTINELEEIVQKIRYVSYLYDRIIDFYKFLSTKNNNIEVPFVELLSLLQIHGNFFTLKTFSQFANFFDHPLDFSEKLRRLKLLESIELNKNLTFLKRSKIVINTDDFDERFSLLKQISDIKWNLHPDDVWFVFRGRGANISDLEKVRDIIKQEWKIDESIRVLMWEHGQIKSNLFKMKELLKTWANVFSLEEAKIIYLNNKINLSNLVYFMEILREHGKMPENDTEKAHMISFIYHSLWDLIPNLSKERMEDIFVQKIKDWEHLETDEIPF